MSFKGVNPTNWLDKSQRLFLIFLQHFENLNVQVSCEC